MDALAPLFIVIAVVTVLGVLGLAAFAWGVDSRTSRDHLH
jgi:cbb3-type cytochrome oxidase maturation protein